MTGTPAKKNFDSVLEGLSCRTNPKEEDISNFNLDDIQVPMDLKGNLQHKHDELLKQKRSIDFGQAKQ